MKKHNFYAGPSILPKKVIKETSKASFGDNKVVETQNTGSAKLSQEFNRKIDKSNKNDDNEWESF